MDRNALAAGVLPRAWQFAKWKARWNAALEEHLTDTATEAVVRALNSFDATIGPFEPHAMAWVARAVLREAGRWLAKRAGLPAAGSFYLEDGPPLDPADGRPHTADLSLELRELPEKLLAPVKLYFLDGHTLEETGRILGIGESTVRLRLEQAAQKLAADPALRRGKGRGKRFKRG